MAAGSLSFVLMLLLVSGCSARIDTEAVDGTIEGYRHADDLQRHIRLTWGCGAKGIVSSLFSPSGESGCNDDGGHGEVLLPISPDGSFRIPAFDVSVTKLFSKPVIYYKWELVTGDEDQGESIQLLAGGAVHNSRHFQGIVAEYSSLRHISFDDVCVPAALTAKDGSRQFPLDDIKQVYPDTRMLTRDYSLNVALRREGELVKSTYIGIDYDQARFCGRHLGLFIPAGQQGGREEFSFFARIEISTNVVYSVSPPDPVSGQRTTDFRNVKKVLVRKAESTVGPVNQLPAELLAPIAVELDITRPEAE